jgi:hypothetical protein
MVVVSWDRSLAARGAALMPERPPSVVTSLIVVVSVIDPISSFQKVYKVNIIPARIDGGNEASKGGRTYFPTHSRAQKTPGTMHSRVDEVVE